VSDTAWSLGIRITLSLLRPVRTLRLVAPTYERLRLAQLRRTDPLQWRVEVARAMGIRVGRDCRLFSLNVFSEPYLLELGDNVIVSGNVTFVTHDGGVYLLGIPNVQGHYGRIKIGSNCFIGMGSIFLPNVQLGDNCVVGAGSVVNRSFGDNCVIMGNPAKMVLSFDMYRALRRDSPFTVVSEQYADPKPIPPDVKRELLERQFADVPWPAPHLSQLDGGSRSAP